MATITGPFSLTQVHKLLENSGVKLPYSSLSQFIALGDIAEQLEVGGRGNRREFPAWTVDFLSQLLPLWEKARLSKDHAPAFVRHHLPQFRGSQNTTSTSSEDFGIVKLPHDQRIQLNDYSHQIDALQLAREYGRAVQDRLLNATEAAAYVGIPRRSLRRNFPASFRIGKSPIGDRWRVSDLLAGPQRQFCERTQENHGS